jgi:peptide-methionine (S)-S-oxide reductase
MNSKEKTEIATLAGGCFWCLEAVFKQVKGVITVIPGKHR